MKRLALFFFVFCFYNVQSQLLLEADGPGGTYALITSKLAPGYNPVESPDCVHTTFGPHVDEIFDATLGQFVFRFHSHVSDDNDRCINFDRQRMEIKTYDKSPDSLLGVVGEVVEYKWKFKLPTGFQSSSNFTHIHQLKARGGTEDSHPVITLTTRKGTPDDLELRHGASTSSTVIASTLVSPLLNEWIEVYEKVTYGEVGSSTYEILLTRLSDGATMLSYTNNSLRMWRTNADFIRPKWGIYRSLNNSQDLRDEQVLFAGFSIEELNTSVPLDLLSFTAVGQEEDVLLNWKTTAEINTLGFGIERMEKNGTTWETIGFVESTNDPDGVYQYQYVDTNPHQGENFYRLKQEDLDGRYEYYGPVSYRVEKNNIELDIYPNPTNNILTINGLTDDLKISIYNAEGEKLSSLTTKNGLLDLSHLDSGIYFLVIPQGGKSLTKKFYKL